VSEVRSVECGIAPACLQGGSKGGLGTVGRTFLSVYGRIRQRRMKSADRRIIPAQAGIHGSGWSFELPDSLRLIDYERD